jgi:hypothetical protein
VAAAVVTETKTPSLLEEELVAYFKALQLFPRKTTQSLLAAPELVAQAVVRW